MLSSLPTPLLQTWPHVSSFRGCTTFADRRHIATYTSAGDTLFTHSDWLGTERMRTNAFGAVNGSYSSLAFGDALSSVGTSPLHFTGQMRDSETGLDEFPARYYSSTQGRWLSPDWSGVPMAIPYADLHDLKR